MEVSDYLHAMAGLTPEKEPWIDSWVGPRAGLNTVSEIKKKCQHYLARN